jgi:secreted trypsin-like serine protease
MTIQSVATRVSCCFLLAGGVLGCGMPEEDEDLDLDGVEEKDSEIVGGVATKSFPAVVEVLVNGEGDCTGSLVSARVVLTAAHCIVEAPKKAAFAIFTGPNDDVRSQGEVVKAKAAHVHPSYNADTDENDMAVLILSKALTIKPLPYNRKALSKSLVGKPVRMIGYGDNTKKEPTAGFGKRRQATAPLIGFDKHWVRVGTAKANQCYGDSGGPVLMKLGTVETIVGVDSFQVADDCIGENFNTRIDTLVGFIDKHVNANK